MFVFRQGEICLYVTQGQDSEIGDPGSYLDVERDVLRVFFNQTVELEQWVEEARLPGEHFKVIDPPSFQNLTKVPAKKSKKMVIEENE